jgi:putative transcriptional regulator
MELKNHIRRLRFEHGDISQETLAGEVGVTRQTIHSIEKGKFIPSTLLAFKLAMFFNVKLEEVFYLVNNDRDPGCIAPPVADPRLRDV